MKLGICLITNIKYAVIFVIFLGTMIVLGYAYQQASNEQVVSAQLPPKSMVVKITSPAENQNLPVGELRISGTSTDNAATDCQVLVDVNDMKPFQKAIATGPGGRNDYSSWSFKYTDAYHLITEGSNELTAKLSCSDKDIKPKWHSVNITGGATKPGTYNILFPTVMNNESSSLLSNNTQQGSPVKEHIQNITSPQGVNKTTDSPYPDVLLEEESTNATNELSIAEDQKLSAVKVKETTPTDTPFPDVLLEEEVIEEEEPEMWPQQQGLQVEQQQMSIAEDQKPSALKVKETTKDNEGEVKEVGEEQPEMKSPLQWFDIDNDRKGLQDEQQQLSIAEDQKPSALKVKETTKDNEGEVKEVGEEQPEMKSPLQMFDIDNDRKVPANEQLQAGHTDVRNMDSAEVTYSKIMSNLE
jgi:hypothetical protein